jgi:hypothetical protein
MAAANLNSNFRHVRNVICFLLGCSSLASEYATSYPLANEDGTESVFRNVGN